MPVVSDKQDDQPPEHDPSSAMEERKISLFMSLGYLSQEVVVLVLPVISSH